MATYHLPMIECSTCGTCIGEKYSTYYRITAYLNDILKSGRAIEATDERFCYGDGDSLGPFLAVYYAWLKTQPPSADLYEPANVVARGLLRLRELKAEYLPFGKANPDGQRNQFEASICCLRMLHLDPSTQTK
jgi:hypothetical protein